MLEKGIKLFQEGKFQEALPILEAHAQEDELTAMLAAQASKKVGDAEGCKRYLFMAANKFGSGDAALMMAQEYIAEENYDSALVWAEQASQKQAHGAGALALRLSEKSGQWDKCLSLALEELRQLEGYERFELCDEIHTLLEGNHYDDQTIVDLVEPVLPSLKDDPVAQDKLKESCQNARERIQKAEEQERRRQEEAKLLQEAQRNRETAKAEAKKKAAEAVEQAKREKQDREAKAAAEKKSSRRRHSLLVAVAFLGMPLFTNGIAHMLVTRWSGGEMGFAYMIGSPILGFICLWLCSITMVKLMDGYGGFFETLNFLVFGPFVLAIFWVPLGILLAAILDMTGLPTLEGDYLLGLGLAVCCVLELRIYREGDVVEYF